ncbi:hypothetical protein [Halomonas sp. LBP4]|uniref:hypothetical protein n=1 Tax=Halomonas sp. LBP4 TaxID=2044917 RepID=UPI000D754F46|nr:hypothetical protein [Halomonas sp. LBP4]PXX95848.1 hypothetical protein CR157_16750 [Halomonas sp. LBP4]
MTKQDYVPRPQLCEAVALGIPADRLEALQVHFEVYTSSDTREIILDMSAIGEEQMPELEEALGFDASVLGSGLVNLWAESPQPLQSYAVLYRDPEQSVLDPPTMFRCQAEDCDHAEEQCLFANLEADVIWIVHVNDDEMDDVEVIERALKMYYTADI